METVEVVLEEFDQKEEPFREVEVHSGLRQIEEPENDEEEFKLKAEKMAFSFTENYPDEHNRWGTYYGPMMTGPTEDGRYFESPSINHVDEDILDYWDERAEEANHPLLKIRYHDLIWEFKKKAINEHPDPSHAEQVIHNTINLIQRDLYKTKSEGKVKLERALSLALQLDQKKLKRAVVEEILEFHEKSKGSGVTLQSFAFDILVEEHDELITDETEDTLVNDLHELFNQLTSDPLDEPSPYEARLVALRLANYYQRSEKTKEKEEVIKQYGNFIKEIVDADVSGMMAYDELLRLHEIYMDYGLSDEAAKLDKKLTEKGEQQRDELQTITHEFEISKEDLKEYYEYILSGDVEDILVKITSQFIPQKDQVEDQLRDLAEENPLTYLIPKHKQDHTGRTVVTFQSIHEDFEGRVFDTMGQNLSIQTPFLNDIMDRLFNLEEISREDIVEYIFESPAFNEQGKKYLQLGFDSYFNEDYKRASHIFLFQIEKAVRNLISLGGGQIYKKNNYGGFDYLTLGSLLNDEMLEKTYGETVIFYLKFLLNDQRGWNLRNKIAHGIMHFDSLNKSVCNRIIHAIITISQARYQEDNV